ncbi:copper amine oxidase N-terminal domain-containing protein [Gracilibacillus oryzae]|nr:copper amine oxidase N-terminal domain-containing protein [Gracilibacillus oryzae]
MQLPIRINFIYTLFMTFFASFLFMNTSASAAGIQETITEEEEYSPSASVVFVDGMKVNYPVRPIIKDGTTLVPLRETFESLGATVKWNEEERSVFATKGNKDLYLKINSHKIMINEQPRQISVPPVIYNGKTMIPLRLVGEAFGGTVEYDPESKIITITMSDLTADFLTKEQDNISNIRNVKEVRMSGDRRLMLSDNPETLNSKTIKQENATLWNDIVKENGESVDHRVVGWHMNKLHKEITVGITIENLSKTNTIEVRKLEGIHKISSNSWYDYDIGLPISESVLNNQLQPVNLSTNKAESGETIMLGSFEIKPNEMIGFLQDFSVTKTSGTGELNYVIRTVVSQNNSDLTQIKSTPVPADRTNMHPRGVWRSSELIAVLPTYHVQQDGELSYNISNGITDNIFNEENSLTENASSISNKGHYGAVYKVKLPYINHTDKEKTVRVRIASRGGSYSGTVKTKDGVFNISALDPNTEVVNVIDYTVEKKEGSIELDIMHSGGSYLPSSINIAAIK